MSAQDISTAALLLFAEKGYDATTIADIAKKTGIKKPSIYAHYSSKMEILLTVLQTVKNNYLTFFRENLDQTSAIPPDDRLRHIFFSISGYFLQHRNELYFWMRVWLFPPVDCTHDVLLSIQETNKQLAETIATIFQQGINNKIFIDETALELAHAYLCMLDGYLVRVMCHPKFDYDKTLSIIWNAFLLKSLKLPDASIDRPN
ncbi:TetR/AcrR family transcriptional regulator [Pectinatus frisingensis]|uniref:TetR/AcrR family transcriptional regulator n=1 Tax=Pectinatus frisingensis TaxID=865 RepID=UPI0018C61852|nr:TetR/AcrR family transcriptional regulator [Pectinatus frisingensis]